ncbi:hypothetical protein NLI96_g2529 [Meripilus lineatus]|uniref:F-box domain-containing protein n=1 Tax=Meripilus lineatus TaxID=2056292 RepID=A0AAD5VAU4_9APHY|nr:hypothetical protein NLI96_g2529 [Physisporinus lineatus]
MPISQFLPSTHPRLSFSRHHQVPRNYNNNVKRSTLPTEILLDIFSVLADDVLDHARLFYYRITTLSIDLGVPTHPVRTSINTLLNTALVCHTWYSAAMEALYRNPILASYKQYRLFSRTLRKTPRLASYIRTAFVFDIQTAKPFPFNLMHQEDRDPERGDYSSNYTILSRRSWPHIGSDNPPSHSNFGISHYRGKCSRQRFPNYLYPLLEVLCLNGFNFGLHHSTVFPPFPRLHTLQLTRTTGWQAYHRLYGSIVALPALDSLELYENDYQSSLAANEYTLPHFPHLRRLYAFGTYEYILFSTLWVTSPTLKQVRELGVGVADNGYDSLDEWEIPPTLELLTVAMRLDLPDKSNPQERPLQYLLAFLQRNSGPIARGVLKKVVILGLTWHVDDPWRKEPIQTILREIKSLCNPLRVEVTWRRSMQNEWIEKEFARVPLPS